MLEKPGSITGIGLVQVLLATFFVIWLLFFPERGADFAWPITPALASMFIGASFIARAYLGYHLWREKYWYRLRWQVWGNLGFLAVIFAATFWHVDEMSWSSSIVMAHIWVLAYAIEPLLLIIIEPRGPEADEPLPLELQEGPIVRPFRRLMITIYVTLFIISALLFLNPEFTATRWPWPFDPFNGRIMAAFPMLGALWAVRVSQMDDWAEAKLAVRGLIIHGAALVILWIYAYPQYTINRDPYGITLIVFTLAMVYGYWWHEARARKAAAVITAETMEA